MRHSYFLIFFSILLSQATATADSTISLPWPEFEQLYKEQIENRIRRALPSFREPQSYSISRADYQLELSEFSCVGTVTVEGRRLGGEVAVIPLFGKEFVLREATSVTGGSLMRHSEDYPIGLLPTTEPGEFTVTLAFVLAPLRERDTKLVKLNGPGALQRSLRVGAAADVEVVELPGIADGDALRRLTSDETISLRYRKRTSQDEQQAPPTVDLVTVLTVADRNLLGTTYLHAAPGDRRRALTLNLPKGARWLRAAVRHRLVDRQTVAIELEDDAEGPHQLLWALPIGHDAPMAVELPTIADNRGDQAAFLLQTPDDARISLTGEGLVENLPASRLPGWLPKTLAAKRFHRVGEGGNFSLSLDRYGLVEMPATVLEEVSLTTAFDDNGGILSQLHLTVPAGLERLQIRAIENATIWSLTVNDLKRVPLVAPDGQWIIPLDNSGSKVTLTFLKHGPKLGLYGRLEATVPDIGLPAQKVLITAQLPTRLELVSMEGPLSAAAESDRMRTASSGRAYAFTQAYHAGGPVTLALYYKEPVKQE